ncbi:MAG: hypothetical protein EB168_03445 [Euryarchaeota archaeon]|jgi:hypothetical protein|nr:hypothetical protein [Euryarchaeota archaeon]
MRQQLLDWMQSFVEQPNPNLGNWTPCPFARAARINNQIDIREGQDARTDHEHMDLESKEVCIFWYPLGTYTGEEFAVITRELNDLLMPKDIVVLEDHPELVETVNGVNMNFGGAILHIIQQLSKLNQASDRLKSRGYYDHWSQEEIDEVVSWRYK